MNSKKVWTFNPCNGEAIKKGNNPMGKLDEFELQTLIAGSKNAETITDEALEILVEKFPFEISPVVGCNPNYLLFRILRKKRNPEIVKIFAEKLGVEKSIAEQILSAEAVDFYFPVVSPDGTRGFILKGSVVKLKGTDKVITPDWEVFSKPESLETIRKITGSGFFVVLEWPIVRLDGFSYSLALYAALTFGKDAEKFAFTGSITEDGRVEEVDHVETKLLAAKEFNKPLIFPAEGGVKTLKQLEEFLYRLRIPVALLPDERDKTVFDKNFPFEGEYIKKVFHVGGFLSNFDPYGETPAETATLKGWIESTLTEVERKIFHFKPKKADYYVAHTQKVLVLSFLSGVVFAKKNIPVEFYKFDREKGYQKVFSLKDARLTSSTPVEKFFKVVNPEGRIKRIFISAKSQQVPLPDGTLGLFAKHVDGQRGLPEGLFLDVAGSLSGFLRGLRNRIAKGANLILELPTALAFALGFALEDYLPVVLTHISRTTKEEIPVFSFAEIPSNRTVYVSDFLSPEWLPEGNFSLTVLTKSVEDFLSPDPLNEREFIVLQGAGRVKKLLSERGIPFSESPKTPFVLNKSSTLAVYFEKNGKGFFKILTIN